MSMRRASLVLVCLCDQQDWRSVPQPPNPQLEVSWVDAVEKPGTLLIVRRLFFIGCDWRGGRVVEGAPLLRA